MFRNRSTLFYYRWGRAAEGRREGETQRRDRERRVIEGEAKCARTFFRDLSRGALATLLRSSASRLTTATRREQLAGFLPDADRPRGERRQFIALTHGLREWAEQMADAVRVIADERTISRHY